MEGKLSIRYESFSDFKLLIVRFWKIASFLTFFRARSGENKTLFVFQNSFFNQIFILNQIRTFEKFAKSAKGCKFVVECE